MIHPNEIRLTSENIEQFMTLAASLSANHVAALKEQATRQEVTYASSI
jgi:hypothetical protein